MSRFRHLGWYRLASAALGLLLVTCVQARELVDLSSVRAQTASPAAIEQARQLQALADGQSTDALVAELQRLLQSATLTSISREWLLDRGLHELARIEPTLTARAFARQITQRPAEIFVRVDPDHGRQTVPLYDPAATARFALRNWDRRESNAKTAAALAAGESWPLEVFARGAPAADVDPIKAGILDAFGSATTDQLRPYRAALHSAMQRGERVDEIAAALAGKLGDPDLCGVVLDRADPPVALATLKQVRSRFAPAHALDLLTRASQRQDIASAAVLEIGHLAARDTQARELLFDQLADASLASSAAAALGSLQDAAIATELGRRLQATQSESMRRQLVLALKLDGSPLARKQLEQFAKAGAGSRKLQKDVGTWLAR